MKSVIVTGGAGMIGSALTKRLRSMDYRVKVVDNLWRGKIENLLDENQVPCIDLERDFFQRDLRLPGQLDDLVKEAEFLIHLADVVAGIGYVFANEREIFRNNILINSNTINSASLSSLEGFIYVGTACSFPAQLQSGVDARPLVESDQYPAAPESAYGWSKLMGEYEATLLEKETDIRTSLLILHNVYGTPCDYEGARAQVIPALVKRVVESTGESLVVWGSGEQGRAFVHVSDVVDALVSAMDRGLGQGPIQIGPDTCTTIRDLAETIVEISGKNIEVQFDTSKPEGDRGRCANYRKAKEVLGWEPSVALRQGVEEVYRWIDTKLHGANI